MIEKVDDLSEEARKQMINEVLAQRGMTQQDLATILGRSLRTVQSWISGESIPELTFEEVLEVSGALDQPLESLAKMFPGTSRRRAGIRRYHKDLRDATSNQKSAQE